MGRPTHKRSGIRSSSYRIFLLVLSLGPRLPTVTHIELLLNPTLMSTCLFLLILNYIVLLPQVHALHPITPAQAESSAAPLRCCLNFLPLWHPGEPSKYTLWFSFTTPYFCRIKCEFLRLASRAIYSKLPATCPASAPSSSL